MTIPLIQGMLKYAYESDPAAGAKCASRSLDCDKALGEAWAFAAAVLPRLNYCDSSVAKLVKDNLDVTAITGALTQGNTQMTDGYAKLKEQVETTYPCLGITCEEVGVYQTTAGVAKGGMSVCTDPTTTSAALDLVAEGLKADTDTISSGETAIAGYIPSSNVVPHSKVDLDMAEINTAVGSGDFATALFVYESGGGGKCTDALITANTGFGSPDACVAGSLDGAVGNSLKSSEIRRLFKFATSTSMAAERWYNIYKNYWKSTGMTADEAAKYSDTNVRPALAGTGGYAAASVSNKMRAEVAKKGVAYQTVWMYVLHEYEDAIMDCLAGDIEGNSANVGGAAPHAWDEGWAFYAGSLEGTAAGDSSTDGVMVYKLASKRCENFGTCNGAAPGTTGVAKANLKHLALARSGRDKILAGDCNTVQEEFDAIVDQMTIPLIQGMLKYAYESDPAAGAKCASRSLDCDKALGEAWAFAAAVLPRLNYCDSSVAKLVKDNLDVTVIAGATASGDGTAFVASPGPQMKDGYAKLKSEVEKTYPCLGITCEEVGVYQKSGVNKGGMEICGSSGSSGSSGSADAATTAKPVVDSDSGAVAAAFAMVLLNMYT